MMDIFTIGADVLRVKAEPVGEFGQDLADTLESMFKTMAWGHGVGLAAPQVGISKRIFVMQIEGDKQRVFINPEIVSTSPELSGYEEGCLSIPGTYAELDRPAAIRIQAYNEKGRPFNLEADGFLARVIQHELDHLDGVLFTDRLPERVRERLLKQYEKRMRA